MYLFGPTDVGINLNGECSYDDASRVCVTHGCVIVYGRQYGCPECSEKLRKLPEASVSIPQENVPAQPTEGKAHFR